MNNEESENSTFEMSLRILGNEFIGFRISVDDFKTKWVIISIMGMFALAGFINALDLMEYVNERF